MSLQWTWRCGDGLFRAVLSIPCTMLHTPLTATWILIHCLRVLEIQKRSRGYQLTFVYQGTLVEFVLSMIMRKKVSYIIRQPDVVRSALSFTAVFFVSFFFEQRTILSSGAEDAHQIYTRGSVVGQALKLDPEILPTLPLIFTGGGQNVWNLAAISTSQDMATKVSKWVRRWWSSVLSKFGTFWSTPSEEYSLEVRPLEKIC